MDINALHKMCTWPMQSHSVAAIIIPLVYHNFPNNKVAMTCGIPHFQTSAFSTMHPLLTWCHCCQVSIRVRYADAVPARRNCTGNRTQSTQLRTVVLLAALTLYKLQRKIRKPPNICQAAQRWSKRTSKACWPRAGGGEIITVYHGHAKVCSSFLALLICPLNCARVELGDEDWGSTSRCLYTLLPYPLEVSGSSLQQVQVSWDELVRW
jgi:hypothetical protein